MLKRNILLLSMLILLMGAFAVMAEEEEGRYYFRYPTESMMCTSTLWGENNDTTIAMLYGNQLISSNTQEGDKYRLTETIVDGSASSPHYYETTIAAIQFGKLDYTYGTFFLNFYKEISYPYTLTMTYDLYDSEGGHLSYQILTVECLSHNGSATYTLDYGLVPVEDRNNDSGDDSVVVNRPSPILTDPTSSVSINGLNFYVWGTQPPSLLFTIPSEQIEAVPSGEQHTLIAQSDNGYYRFYRLNTGELQLNTGPDFEGKEFVTVFNAGGQVVKTYTIDPQ